MFDVAFAEIKLRDRVKVFVAPEKPDSRINQHRN
jgi:hypothetical protein